MKFFTYNQNNSGGEFSFDKKRGITHLVIIEASDADHADSRAENIGIYFNGCDDGRDCSCCGDRWSPAYGKGDDVPSYYDTPIEDNKIKMNFTWMGKNPEAVIHYADGRVQWVEAV